MLAAQSILLFPKTLKIVYILGDAACKHVSGTTDRHVRLVILLENSDLRMSVTDFGLLSGSEELQYDQADQ